MVIFYGYKILIRWPPASWLKKQERSVKDDGLRTGATARNQRNHLEDWAERRGVALPLRRRRCCYTRKAVLFEELFTKTLFQLLQTCLISTTLLTAQKLINYEWGGRSDLWPSVAMTRLNRWLSWWLSWEQANFMWSKATEFRTFCCSVCPGWRHPSLRDQMGHLFLQPEQVRLCSGAAASAAHQSWGAFVGQRGSAAARARQ